MVSKNKLTIDEKIALAEKKLKKLQDQKKTGKSIKLTKDSIGMEALLAHLDDVASKNKVKISEVILAVARIKRTGLKLVAAEKDSNAYLL